MKAWRARNHLGVASRRSCIASFVVAATLPGHDLWRPNASRRRLSSGTLTKSGEDGDIGKCRERPPTASDRGLRRPRDDLEGRNWQMIQTCEWRYVYHY
jgi:hypothetical protein